MTSSKKLLRILLICSFISYIVCLTYLPFFGYERGFIYENYTLERYKAVYTMSTNFIPFRTIILYMSDGGRHLNPGIAFENIAGNIVAFSPFGLYMPLFFKRFRSWIPFITFAVITPILVESVQYITLLGGPDIDDIILNTVGSILISLFSSQLFYQNLFLNLLIEQKRNPLPLVGSFFCLFIHGTITTN